MSRIRLRKEDHENQRCGLGRVAVIRPAVKPLPIVKCNGEVAACDPRHGTATGICREIGREFSNAAKSPYNR